MAHLEIRLLGTFEVTLEGDAVTTFATDKARALLAYLAVESEQAHRRDTLAGLLWPDQPQRKARQNLRQALSHMRQTIEPPESSEFLLVTRETVQFNSESDYWVDVSAFSDFYEANKRHHHRGIGACRTCLQRVEAMISLYHGDFMKGFFLSDSTDYEEWALLKREWYHLHVVESLTILASYYERRGAYTHAREYVRQQVALEPWREEAHRQLMRLFAVEGERSAALRQYQKCRQVLQDELGVEPTSETIALFERIRTEETVTCDRMDGSKRPSTLCPSIPSYVLPQSPTSFVGREPELAALHDLLANPDCRLLTLVGPGGIGKSRLAVQAAQEQLGLFAHGVAFIPLVAVTSQETLIVALVDALNIVAHVKNLRAQLLDYLRDKSILLVLDNFEQLLDSVDLLDAMLRMAPGVVLLVTSRERLNLRQEWLYEVQGLHYPDDDGATDIAYSAVELFHQRATQSDQHFVLDAATLPFVVRICQLVEGMPLAVELAAALVSLRTCSAIAQEIAHNIDVLTTRLRNLPKRHRSIRAAFEHSWQLLSDAERRLFSYLSVFRGGFDERAAASVAGATPTVLLTLLDKSLTRRIADNRYDMHELLRQYAAELLESDAQTCEDVSARHANYYIDFLVAQLPALNGEEQQQALRIIALEIENARQAWHYAVVQRWGPIVARAIDSLYTFCRIQARFEEGIALFSDVITHWFGDLAEILALSADMLALFREEHDVSGKLLHVEVQSQRCVPDSAKHSEIFDKRVQVFGRALARIGALYHHQGHFRPARIYLEQAVSITGLFDAPTERAFTMIYLADVHIGSSGDYDQALLYLEQALVIAQQVGDCWATTRALCLTGMAYYRKGQIDKSEQYAEQGLTSARSSGNPHLILFPLNILADLACHRGDYVRARPIFEECLALSRKFGDPYYTALQLNNIGTVLHTIEQYDDAWAAYSESMEICRDIGDQKGLAIVLSNLGEIAYVLGNYDEARIFYHEALDLGRTTRDLWTVMASLNNFGEIACAVGDYIGARPYLTEAFEVTYETKTLPVFFKVVVNVADFFVKQEQPELAKKLLALALHHPASEQATQERAQQLVDTYGLLVPNYADVVLEHVVDEVLGELHTA